MADAQKCMWLTGEKLTCSATSSVIGVCSAGGGRPAVSPRIAPCHCSICPHGDRSCTQQCTQAVDSLQGDCAGLMDQTTPLHSPWAIACHSAAVFPSLVLSRSTHISSPTTVLLVALALGGRLDALLSQRLAVSLRADEVDPCEWCASCVPADLSWLPSRPQLLSWRPRSRPSASPGRCRSRPSSWQRRHQPLSLQIPHHWQQRQHLQPSVA